MFLRRSRLIAVLLGLLLVSACTTTSEGAPQPATTKSSSAPGSETSGTSEEELPFAGAPKVAEPLDTSRFEDDPCESLTAKQAKSLKLPATGELNDEFPLGIGCDWYNRETWGEVSINFLTDDPTGLSSEYQANERGKWEVFKELPEIEGFPAVIRTTSDTTDLGHCTVVVGVADDMAFESVLQLSRANVGEKDPCEMAVQVAGLALTTMKEGA